MSVTRLQGQYLLNCIPLEREIRKKMINYMRILHNDISLGELGLLTLLQKGKLKVRSMLLMVENARGSFSGLASFGIYS